MTTFSNGPSKNIFTDRGDAYQRLRVDVGQTGFFAGREFRTFYEFSITTGTTRVVKFSCPVDTILQDFFVSHVDGDIRIEAKTGGTEGGSFATLLPVLPTNYMSSASGYVAQTVLSTGGTITGGTVRDLMISNLPTGAAHQELIILAAESPVGRAATDLYITITSTGAGTATGILKLRWEERLP